MLLQDLATKVHQLDFVLRPMLNGFKLSGLPCVCIFFNFTQGTLGSSSSLRTHCDLKLEVPSFQLGINRIRRRAYRVINHILHPNSMCRRCIEGLRRFNIIGGDGRCRCSLIIPSVRNLGIQLAPA
jgi:hypothetical protein